jgi:hypothetical protein
LALSTVQSLIAPSASSHGDIEDASSQTDYRIPSTAREWGEMQIPACVVGLDDKMQVQIIIPPALYIIRMHCTSYASYCTSY